MAKIDYTRTNQRAQMRRYGSEAIRDFGIPFGLTPPRKRQSKADARAELERLMLDYKKKKPRLERRGDEPVTTQKPVPKG